MLVIGLVLAGVAALIHIYIFYLESVVWTSDRARKTFGIGSREQAEAMQELAFNQGFYNLFLAVVTIIGTAVLLLGHPVPGLTMVLVGTGCMVAAGLVLLISSPTKAAAALKQLTVPALAVLTLAVGLAA